MIWTLQAFYCHMSLSKGRAGCKQPSGASSKILANHYSRKPLMSRLYMVDAMAEFLCRDLVLQYGAQRCFATWRVQVMCCCVRHTMGMCNTGPAGGDVCLVTSPWPRHHGGADAQTSGEEWRVRWHSQEPAWRMPAPPGRQQPQRAQQRTCEQPVVGVSHWVGPWPAALLPLRPSRLGRPRAFLSHACARHAPAGKGG